MRSENQASPKPDRSLLERLLGYQELDPDNDSLRRDIFDEALRIGALEIAEQQLTRSGSDAPWVHRRAMLAMRRGDYAGAREALLRLVQQGEGGQGARYNAAYAAFREGDHATARSEALALLEQDDPLPQATALCLRAMHHLGQIEEGIAIWRRLQAVRPQDAAAFGVASLMAVDAAQFEEAERWARQALQQDAAQLEALTALGSVALARQQAPQARALIEKALSLSAGDGRVLSALAMCELGELRPEVARPLFERALSAMPRHIGTWHGLAWCCIAQEDFAAAERAFEAALALDRNFAESHGGVAVVCALQGRKDEGKEAARRALGLDPQSLTANYALALLNGEVSDAEKLKRLASRMLRGRKTGIGERTVFDAVAPLLDRGESGPDA